MKFTTIYYVYWIIWLCLLLINVSSKILTVGTSELFDSVYFNSIKFFSNGDYIVGGTTSKSVFGLFLVGELDILLLKYDANNNYLWGKILGTSSNDSLGGIQIDITDNIYIAGMYGSTIVSSKFTSNGKQIYRNSMEGNGQVNGIVVDTTNNYYYVYGSTDSSSLDGINNPLSTLSYAQFIIKYQVDGVKIKTIFLGSTGNNYAYDMIVNNQGNLVMVGYSSSNYYHNINSGSNDGTLALIHSNMTILHTYLFGNISNDMIVNIRQDSFGYYYILGITSSNNILDNILDHISNHDTTKASTNIWIFQLNASFHLNSTGFIVENGNDHMNDMYLNKADEMIYLCGKSLDSPASQTITIKDKQSSPYLLLVSTNDLRIVASIKFNSSISTINGEFNGLDMNKNTKQMMLVGEIQSNSNTIDVYYGSNITSNNSFGVILPITLSLGVLSSVSDSFIPSASTDSHPKIISTEVTSNYSTPTSYPTQTSSTNTKKERKPLTIGGIIGIIIGGLVVLSLILLIIYICLYIPFYRALLSSKKPIVRVIPIDRNDIPVF